MGLWKRLQRAGERVARRAGERFVDAIERSLDRLAPQDVPAAGPAQKSEDLKTLNQRGSRIHIGPESPTPGLAPDDPLVRFLRRPEFGELMDMATMEKALSMAREAASDSAEAQEFVPTSDPRGLYVDPYAVVQQMGFRDRPSHLTYHLQELMVWRSVIPHVIIHTRAHQLASHMVPTKQPYETGSRIRLRNEDDHPTAADKKFMAFMMDSLLRSGTTQPGPYNLAAVAKLFTRATMFHDQWCVEKIRDRNGRPCTWLPIDEKTIRLADTRRLYPDNDPERVHTVQIYDNIVIGEFTRAEMSFAVRNPRTDVRTFGYGTPEIEFIVAVITAWLNAYSYNAGFFTQGTVAKGLLNIMGSVPEKQLKAFKRLWFNMVSGIENAWRSVVLNAEKVEWIPLHPNNRDMEFSSFFDFLVKLICGTYLTNPIEIGFKYGNTNQRAMVEAAQKQQVTESRERGLRPNVRTFEQWVNEEIIWPWSNNFVFEITGLQSMTAKEQMDLLTQRVRSVWKVNEVRAELDLPSDRDGDVILDANYIGVRQNRLLMEQQEKQAKMSQQGLNPDGTPNLEGALAALTGGSGTGSGGPPAGAPGSGGGLPTGRAPTGRKAREGVTTPKNPTPKQPKNAEAEESALGEPAAKSLTAPVVIDITV